MFREFEGGMPYQQPVEGIDLEAASTQEALQQNDMAKILAVQTKRLFPNNLIVR